MVACSRWTGRCPACWRMREEDLVIFTADHGNDPTTPSTDHAREVVPVLAVGPRVGRYRSVGVGRLPTSARRWPTSWASRPRGGDVFPGRGLA